ncbi:hypothetical protein D3C71_846550 [compost metagenome]
MQWHFLGHAHGAEHLHRVVDHFPRHLGGEHLDHGDLAARLVATIDACGCFVGHESTGVNARGRVGNPPLHRLAFGERGAEGAALRCVLAHHVERALGAADAPCGHLQAPARQARLHRREPLAFLAEQACMRYATVFEQHLVGRDAADHGDATLDAKARGVAVDDERRDGWAPHLGLVRDGHDDGPVRARGAADPDLAAIENPVVAVAHGARRHGRRVGARAGLRNGDGRNRLSACVRGQVGGALRVVGGGQQHPQIGRVGGQLVGRDGLAEFFVHPDHRHHRQVEALHFGGRIEAPQATGLRHGVQPRVLVGRQLPRFTGGLPLQQGRFQRQQVFAHEAGDKLLERLVFGVEFEIHSGTPSLSVQS